MERDEIHILNAGNLPDSLPAHAGDHQGAARSIQTLMGIIPNYITLKMQDFFQTPLGSTRVPVVHGKALSMDHDWHRGGKRSWQAPGGDLRAGSYIRLAIKRER